MSATHDGLPPSGTQSLRSSALSGPTAYAALLAAAVALCLVWSWRAGYAPLPLILGGGCALAAGAAWWRRATRRLALLEGGLACARDELDRAEARNAATADYARYLEQLSEEYQVMGAELDGSNAALAEANARLEALATTDPLTDLLNHRALVSALDQEFERALRYGRSCAVLFLDVDHFKALNDGCGHAAGDLALREFGTVARAALRGADILGRWGGEEFLAVLPEADATTALIAAERVRVAVAGHIFSAGGGVRLTCSMGVAAYPGNGEGRDAVVNAADRAMYAAKRLGRNQVRAANDPAAATMDPTGGEAGSREEAMMVGTVEALAALVEARDLYTGQHTHEVAALTLRLALALGLDATEARLVELAGRLHDIGKVAIPDAVLQKNGSLSEGKWALMRTHPAIGADVVRRVPILRALSSIIHAHHERWDGQGYPDGVAGEAIPMGARIVAVADTYGAMTTDRPYRQACAPAEALAEVRRCAGGQFDPVVVDALDRILAADPALAAHAVA